jgi:hypothetical protein
MVRFRADLEEAGVPTPVIKAMTIVQSILTFAIREELVEYNAAAAVKKTRYDRTREPYIFTPDEVEQMRSKVSLRDADLGAGLLRTPSRGGRPPAGLGRHRGTSDPLHRYQATPRSLYAACRAARR